MKRDALVSSIENSNLDVLALINILCLDFLSFLRGEGGRWPTSLSRGWLLPTEGLVTNSLLKNLTCESFREYFTYEVVYRQKCSLLLTFTRLKSLASLVILTSGEGLASLQFIHILLFTYAPQACLSFVVEDGVINGSKKLIMRLQPIKLKYGSGSGIILAATTSAIKTSKGSVCYFISH